MKIRLSPWVLKLVQRFLDVEASGEVSILDGRTIEYAFTISKLMQEKKPKTLLDVGCVAKINLIPPLMAQSGWNTYGMDIREYKFTHKNFSFLQGDLLSKWPSFVYNSFNYVTCVSTLEHIGLKGRYGIDIEVKEADHKAVEALRSFLVPKGRLLVTLPYSKESKISTNNRVYNRYSVDKLFSGLKLLDKEVWVYKDTWIEVDEITDNREGLVLLDYEKIN